MVEIPAASGAAGELQSAGSPFHRISPEVGASAPATILKSVDLPAPFAPTMPCTVRRSTFKSTPFSASVPFGNRLVMFVNSSNELPSPGRLSYHWPTHWLALAFVIPGVL